MADSCAQYVNADDLKAAKESILHIEHVATSKDGNGDPALVVTDPIRGVNYTNTTLDGLFADIGFKPVNGSFEDSGELKNRWDVLLYEINGSFYQWTGALPHTVPAGSSPFDSSGQLITGWVDQTDLTLRAQLSASGGAGNIGFGNTTVERALNKEVYIDWSAPVADYGPFINDAQQSGQYGGKVKLRGERYPVLTTIQRRAGWTIEGVGPYATELYWGGSDAAMMIMEPVALQSRSGKTIGNASGQYHTALRDLSLIGNGSGIGLWRREAWWDLVERVIIENFDIGEKDGIGTSNVTGCYWCRNEQVWYRNNRINLHVTDYTNLNTWANCRFSEASVWDIEFIEPTSPLTLGQQGNRFVDCEFASLDSVFLGARIFDMNFHNGYFEQPGYAVYDGTAHTKNAISFTGTTKIFGASSTKNKIVAGRNGGNCQNWSFHNIRTNLGKGAGAPATMQVIDMGPTANYFSAFHPTMTGVAGWELTQPSNYNKLGMQLYDVNGKSILQMSALSTDRLVANSSHVTIDYAASNNRGVDLYRKGVSLGELTTTWATVLQIPDFIVQFACSTLHYELSIAGRNQGNGTVKAAHICGEANGNTGTLANVVEIFNRQTGSTAITVEYQAIQSGTSLLVQVRKSAASTAVFDQVFCAVDAKSAGFYIGLAV